MRRSIYKFGSNEIPDRWILGARRSVLIVTLLLVLPFANLFALSRGDPCVVEVRLSDAEAQQKMGWDAEYLSQFIKIDAYYTKLESQKCWDELLASQGIDAKVEYESQRRWVAFELPILVGDRLCKIRMQGANQLDPSWANPLEIEEDILAHYLSRPASSERACVKIPLQDYVHVMTDIADDSLRLLLKNIPTVASQVSAFIEADLPDSSLPVRTSSPRVTDIGVFVNSRGESHYRYFVSAEKSYQVIVEFDEYNNAPSLEVYK